MFNRVIYLNIHDIFDGGFYLENGINQVAKIGTLTVRVTAIS